MYVVVTTKSKRATCNKWKENFYIKDLISFEYCFGLSIIAIESYLAFRLQCWLSLALVQEMPAMLVSGQQENIQITLLLEKEGI